MNSDLLSAIDFIQVMAGDGYTPAAVGAVGRDDRLVPNVFGLARV